MRLGLLADIHEEVDLLQRAVDALESAGVSRFVVLGDVCETGRAIEATVAVLSRLNAVGVWGNHDFGLCREVSAEVRGRYPPHVLEYFGGLLPWAEVGGCRFQHIEPFLDSERMDDLWAYGGDGQLNPARSFQACPHRRIFMGHVHRWELVTPDGVLPWAGREPVRLDQGLRHLVVVHAIQQGWCAWYDTEEDLLWPLRIA